VDDVCESSEELVRLTVSGGIRTLSRNIDSIRMGRGGTVKRYFAILVSISALLVLAPISAGARNTMHDYSIEFALASETAEVKLLEVPIYFAGQSHPAVANDLGFFKANRRTNAFNKTDEAACEIAFLSAVIALQSRAKSQGGDAVIDIKSITNTSELESTTQYRCSAGNVVANVVLTGRVVRLGK
jgi:hypothetical protein